MISPLLRSSALRQHYQLLAHDRLEQIASISDEARLELVEHAQSVRWHFSTWIPAMALSVLALMGTGCGFQLMADPASTVAPLYIASAVCIGIATIGLAATCGVMRAHTRRVLEALCPIEDVAEHETQQHAALLASAQAMHHRHDLMRKGRLRLLVGDARLVESRVVSSARHFSGALSAS